MKRVRFCPRCGSPDIKSYGAGITGTYLCPKCGYMGPLILEQDIQKTHKK